MDLHVNDSLSKEKFILFLNYPLVSDDHIKILYHFFSSFSSVFSNVYISMRITLARLFKVLGPLDHFYLAFLFPSIIIIFQYVAYFSYLLYLLLLVHLPLENISILTLFWAVIFFVFNKHLGIGLGSKSKSKQIGLCQTNKLLHSKGNNQ